MMIKKWILPALVIFLPLELFAQTKDFGIWYGISAEHKFSKKLEMDLSTNLRTFDNASRIDEVFLEGGLGYNFSKYLSVAGAYRITEKLERNDSYYLRHKIFLDFKGTLPVRNFSFSGRFRFQTTSKTYIRDENDNYPYYTGRVKIKTVYKTSTFPIDPYVYAECFLSMFSGNAGEIERMRYSAGLELKIAKRHSFEAEYIYQRDFVPHISDMNILSLNYDLKF